MRTVLAFVFLIASQYLAWPLALELNEKERCAATGGIYDYVSDQCHFKQNEPNPGFWQSNGIVLLAAVALGVAGCSLLFTGRRE